MAEPVLTLPADLVEWVGEVAGGEVVSSNRMPGGASREAWFLDVRGPGGSLRPLFLRYSRTPTPPGDLFHSLHVEGEIIMALQGTGVSVPTTLAVHPVHEAILEERVPGQTWFYRIKDPDEQVAVARDFITKLAALHRLDPATLELPSLGPLKGCRELALDEVANMRRRATGPDGWIDPLVDLSLTWLEKNVPDYEGPVVLVQGDTGPGNFLYEGGKVTAVVDWELAHFGDPMDDIAWLSLRTVQDTFTHLPDRLAEYEALSGHTLDEDRIWYYRLFAETRLNSGRRGGAGAARDRQAEPGQPAVRDVGNGLIYGMLHRRLTVEALAHVAGIELPDEPLPEEPEPVEWHYLYDAALGMLQTIVPRIEDPLASQWSKGVARVVKYLKEMDRAGRAFEQAELDDLARLLGTAPPSVEEGRRRLADALRQGTVSDRDYIAYVWNKVRRDDHLMRTASGALRERTWPPIR